MKADVGQKVAKAFADQTAQFLKQDPYMGRFLPWVTPKADMNEKIDDVLKLRVIEIF